MYPFLPADNKNCTDIILNTKPKVLSRERENNDVNLIYNSFFLHKCRSALKDVILIGPLAIHSVLPPLNLTYKQPV